MSKIYKVRIIPANQFPTEYGRPAAPYNLVTANGEMGALTPDPLTNIPPPITFGGGGTGISIPTYTPTYTPPPPPPFTQGGTSTVQTIANQVSSQLRFDQIAALISQGIAAWGRNPSQQISGLTVRAVQPEQQPQYVPYGAVGQNQQPFTQGGVGASAVNTATGFFDGIAASFGVSPTTMFLIVGVGAYLLFRPAPSRR